jgi:hypothetical protein
MGGIQIRNRILDIERPFDVHDGKADVGRQPPRAAARRGKNLDGPVARCRLQMRDERYPRTPAKLKEERPVNRWSLR